MIQAIKDLLEGKSQMKGALDANSVTVFLKDTSNNVIFGRAATMPNAKSGYAIGCMLEDSTNGAIYVNSGTAASCTFNNVGAVAASEIALTSAHVLVGNASNVAADVAMSGVVAISNTGATTIPLTSANILVGNGSNLAAPVAVSGVVAIDNTGATTIPLTSANVLVGNASNLAAPVAVSGIIALSNAGVASIPLTSANILVGNGSNVAAGVAVSGVVAIDNTGATTIPLTSANILVGNGSNLAAPVAMSADATMANTGAVTIANGAVTRTKMSEAAGSKGQTARPATIATTGTTSEYMIVEETGSLASIEFSGVDALATSDTNYITFAITNLGQAGAGSTAMLAATDANTTKATGGSAISANTKRSLTRHGTAANLDVVAGDRLKIDAVVTNTLANSITFPTYLLRFNGTT